MRMFRGFVLLIGLALAGTAFAQTNQVRALALEDCIQLALEHNLDVQIERFNPALRLYELREAYQGYDPQLEISGQHDFAKSGEVPFQGGLLMVPGRETETDLFRSSLAGQLPWGLRYSLEGSARDEYGTRFDPTNNTFVPKLFGSSGASAALVLRQPLLKNFWIDQTRLAISVAKNRLQQSELALQQQIMDTIIAVELAYYDLIFAHENVKVQAKGLQLAERLFAENKKRVEVGVLAPLDEKQAESQVAARRADLLAAQRALEIQQNVLKNLITDNFAAWKPVELHPTEPLAAPRRVFDVQSSWGRGLTRRPELLQAKLELERAGIQLKYLRNQLLPQLDVFGSYGQAGSGPEFSDSLHQVRRGSQPFHSYGAVLTIPLGNTGARNRFKSGKVAVEQALLAVKQLEQTIMVQIDDATKQAQASYERVDATRAAREYAEAALEAEQKKLESGKSTSFFVLQLQRDLTAARSEEIRALTEYNRALAQLARFEGSTLERHRVELQFR